MNESLLVLGATSAMAQETARLYAARGADVCLVARSAERLAVLAEDLRTRGAKSVHTLVFDLADVSCHGSLMAEALEKLPIIDVALIAYGVLGSQKEAERRFAAAEEILHVNFVSAVSLLTLLANHMESAKRGTIAVITSVAGDRGRKSNYVYGSAKAGLGAFLQGLRNRLFASGVKVVTIKPGFVDTPMTAGIEKGPLFVSAETAGKGIERAIRRGSDVAYVPSFWRIIMLVIKMIPEIVFKRLSL